MFFVCFLYVICQMYVFCMFVEMAWSNVCFMYVLCMLYVCFIMSGFRSLNYDWFPLNVYLNQRYEYSTIRVHVSLHATCSGE